MTSKSTSTTHVRKRQYQPSITSFFTEKGQLSHTCESTGTLSPLPAETQALLLNVGMRIRKSVPEGYKTHKTVSERGYSVAGTSPVSSQPHPTRVAGTSRELTPFCGLHKIGGLVSEGSGGIPSSSAPAAMQTSMGDSLRYTPGLSFSQTTLDSQESILAGGHHSSQAGSAKRTYDEAVEAEMDAFFDEIDDDHDDDGNVIARRPIAKPRGHSRHPVARNAPPTTGLINDFEEASFLAPPDGMEVDEDVAL